MHRERTRRRGRPPLSESRDLRTEVIDAAVDVFTREGFIGTSMAAIADRAGITPASIYYHFNDKNSLFAEVYTATVATLWAGIRDRVAELDDAAPVERLEVLLDASEATGSRASAFMLRANFDVANVPELHHLAVRRDKARSDTLRMILGSDGDEADLDMLEILYTGWAYEFTFRPHSHRQLREAANRLARAVFGRIDH